MRRNEDESVSLTLGKTTWRGFLWVKSRGREDDDLVNSCHLLIGRKRFGNDQKTAIHLELVPLASCAPPIAGSERMPHGLKILLNRDAVGAR